MILPMDIIDRTNEIKIYLKNSGDYRYVAQHTGVGYHWLVKFANGAIANPGVQNISKLDSFFKLKEECNPQSPRHQPLLYPRS